MEKPDYSIIVPVFNNANSLPELLERLTHTLQNTDRPFELIFVDDGSQDHSWHILQQLKQQSTIDLRLIRLNKNFGQHNATFCGMTEARGETLITIDADLQIPPESISDLIKKQQQNDVDLVYGQLIKKQHSTIRNVGSSALKKGSGYLHARQSHGSSFRLINRKLANAVLSHQHNFIYLDEIFNWHTHRIAYVQVPHEKRKSGPSGYNSRKLINLFSNILIYYTAVPLKWMVYGGLTTSVFSFVFGLVFILRKLYYNVPLGYTSLIVTILFSTSLILFSLGIIGEYIRRIYLIENKKPPYSIKEIIQ